MAKMTDTPRKYKKYCDMTPEQKEKKKKYTREYSKRHPLKGDLNREWRRWCSMKDRCLSPKNTSYERYGGSGIKICDRWLESFQNFADDMGKCPLGMTLDRIDSKGNYTPENCRWATPTTQARNRSMDRRNTSGYRGVTHYPDRQIKKQWFAHICADRKQYHLGWYATAEEAALAYDAGAIQLHGVDAKVNLLYDLENN